MKEIKPESQVHETIDLKVMVFNAENLFILTGSRLDPSHLEMSESDWRRASVGRHENKPLYKLKAIAKIIFQENPDLVLLCEVGGEESLSHFAHLFLRDEYAHLLIEGNSERHIDVGFLIKKQSRFYFDIHSNKNRPINYLYPHERGSKTSKDEGNGLVSHKFSRDAAELFLFYQDRNHPFLVFLLTHLKSKLDPDGIDPSGYGRRQAELETLLDICLDHETRWSQSHSSPLPLVVCGDFNGNASTHQTDPEFLKIYTETQIRDVCELARLSLEESYTFFQLPSVPGTSGTFGISGVPGTFMTPASRVSSWADFLKPSSGLSPLEGSGKQLDYAFLSPGLVPHLDPSSVFVYRYQDEGGRTLPPPQSYEEKLALPSDHYPLFFTLRNLKLF